MTLAPSANTDELEAKWESPKIQFLIGSVIDMMVEQGFHPTSVRQISAAAGWNMATLYHYISDKQELLYYIRKWIYTRISEFVGKWPPDESQPATELLRELMARYYSAIHANRDYLIFLVAESRDFKEEHKPEGVRLANQRIAAFENLIRLGIEQGEFSKCDPNLVARLIFALGWGLIHRSVVPEAAELTPYITTCQSVVIDGILSDTVHVSNRIMSAPSSKA